MPFPEMTNPFDRQEERNPPAFPSPAVKWREDGRECVLLGPEGMTLRDYFAAKVIPTLITPAVGEHAAAAAAYAVADAMLAAREPPEPTKPPSA